MRYSRKLVADIIDVGRSHGLSAGDIAVRAGIAPANLSRVRRTGHFNADTLERLLTAARAEVSVTARRGPKSRTLTMVARKLNAGRREHISADELRRLLLRFQPSATAERAFSHLVGVVEELPIEQVHDLVIENDASLPALKRIADYVEGEGPTVDWINEQIASGHELADAT